MGLAKDYKTDAAKEVDGVDVEVSSNDDGTIVKMRLSRMGKANKRYTKAFEAATRPHRRQIELKTLPEAVAEKMLREVFAETVLIGWQNVQNEDLGDGSLLFPGYAADEKAVPYNKENALALFAALPELYDALSANANDVSLFRTDAVENEAKN